MSQIYIDQETRLAHLAADQQLQKDELEATKKMLSETINTMIKEHKAKREKVEDDTWKDIELLKEKNKEELAREIDQGMKQKSDLKLIKNEQGLKEAEKLKLDE